MRAQCCVLHVRESELVRALSGQRHPMSLCPHILNIYLRPCTSFFAAEFEFNTASPKLNQLVTALCGDMVRAVVTHGAVALAFAFGARRHWRTRQTGEHIGSPLVVVAAVMVIVVPNKLSECINSVVCCFTIIPCSLSLLSITVICSQLSQTRHKFCRWLPSRLV